MPVSETLSSDDRLSIAALMVRYATGIDRRDWTLFRTCFTDDFEADYPGFPNWRGGDQITRGMEQLHLSFGATMHCMSNIAIEPALQGATARSYVDALLMPGDPHGIVSQAKGFYDDVLVRTADGWRIASRRFTMVRFQQSIDRPAMA